MRKLRRPLSLLLCLLLLLSCVPALASDAYGQALIAREISLREDVTLHTGTFWSSYYTDLRQEYYVEYTPGDGTRPVVFFGDYVTDRSTLTAAAQEILDGGERVAAGVNADFFDSNGVPTGLLVSDGMLLSSDGGNYAVGFREDGLAVIGRPGLSISSTVNGEGHYYIAAINKARSDKGGICFYTYGFNAANTTGTTDPGVDVLLEPVDGEEVRAMLEEQALEALAAEEGVTVEELSGRQKDRAIEALNLPDAFAAAPAIGETVYYRVAEVTERQSGARALEEGQAALSVNAAASREELDYLLSMEEGDLFGLTVTAADETWNDVTEAAGGLYLLVEEGRAKTGFGTSNAPRTAVGVREDGSVVLYTVDGRRSGYSIGSSLDVLAQRMVELGCVTAICFDGGGSTTAGAALPDTDTFDVINRPSDNSQRRVTSSLLLVSDAASPGRADLVYLDLENPYVLAGSTVTVRAALMDSAYYPMDDRVTLSASAGETDGLAFTAPETGGTVTLTAEARGESARLEVRGVETPAEL